jgi:quercetin dioxygenase-like cupin family protein
MNHRTKFTMLFLILIAAWAAAQPMGHNVAEMKFGEVPGVPTCTTGAVQSGNPMNGAFIILAKVPPKCSIPWHWHTANENLMIVSGTARIDVKDGKSMTLQSGGFATMPAHHVHQFRCTTSCKFYLYSDGAFDIHYVDGKGTEISPDDALKGLKEKAAKPPAS